jgi:hypothetical protein
MFCVAILGRRNPTELEGSMSSNFQKESTHNIFIAFLLIVVPPGKITFKKKHKIELFLVQVNWVVFPVRDGPG